MGVVQVIKQVRDELGMPKNSEIRHTADGRWICSDGFTFILASKKHQNISLWAEMHMKMETLGWQIYKAGLEVERFKHLPVSFNLLAQCHKEPKTEIILKKSYGEVSVVAYTDSMYEIILEGKQIEGKKINSMKV
jgi:hypothetical protein